MTYAQLLQLILPVFGMVALGVVLRRVHWVEGAAETSLLRLVIFLFFPCLIFESVVANPSLHSASNLLFPPLVGAVTTLAGMGLAWLTAGWLGFAVGTGRRTFTLSAGLGNYSYMALPILTGLFGPDIRAVLFVHNIGIEATLWSVGVLVLSGLSPRDGWKKVVNPMVVTLILAVVLNLTGAGPHLPEMLMAFVHALAGCAIPLGLLLTGINLANYLNEPRTLFDPKVTLSAIALRFAVLPVGFVLLARVLPCSLDLKRVIVVQGAMPAAVIPIILAQHYGGRPLTAVQIVLGTTAVAVLVTPLWLGVGFAWAGI
jgi:predicted permease